jgi:hypothetical protein
MALGISWGYGPRFKKSHFGHRHVPWLTDLGGINPTNYLRYLLKDQQPRGFINPGLTVLPHLFDKYVSFCGMDVEDFPRTLSSSDNCIQMNLSQATLFPGIPLMINDFYRLATRFTSDSQERPRVCPGTIAAEAQRADFLGVHGAAGVEQHLSAGSWNLGSHKSYNI